MRMKVFLVLIVLQFMLNEKIFCQQIDSNGIYVKNLGFDVLTFAAITCDKFVSYQHPGLKFRHIINKDSLAMLDSFLGKVKFKKKNKEIDVRAQIKYKKDDKIIVTICFDSVNAMINGRLIKRNDQFVAFLISLMP